MIHVASVLIVANPEDLHAKFIGRTLEQRSCDVRFLHIARFARTAAVSVQPRNPPCAEVIDSDAVLDLDGVATVWYRRQGRPELPPDLTADDQAFALREWEQTLDGIVLSLDAKFVNPVGAQRAAVKPRQLVVASRHGLRVPETLITSSPSAAIEFIDVHSGRVVHKTMSAPRHLFAATQRWQAGDERFLANLGIAPVMFQEEISGACEIRATIVGDDVFAARIETDANTVDSRLRPDAPCDAWALPDQVCEAALRTMRSLGLVFGTMDLKIDDNGEYVFFEINPQGQFLYIEILTGLPISDALASLLAS